MEQDHAASGADAAQPDSTGHTHEGACLNCGTALLGRHCHACGQRAHVHRTLGAFFHDLLHGVLHFEGKTWRTLPMLAWRPGELTRRYIDGERAKFVSPLALFLFTVFVMFAVFSSLGGPIATEQSEALQAEMSASAQQAQARVAELGRQRSAAKVAGQPTEQLDAQIKEVRETSSLIDQISREGFLTGIGHRIVDDLPEGFVRTAVEKFNKDPALALYKLQTNAYKFSWLLIPISVPLMWLLFIWRREHWQLYDHTVFITYSLSFQWLLFILFIVLARFGLPLLPLFAAMGVIVSVHVYWQFRDTYSLRPFSAMWRMTVLTLIAGIAMILFALAIIALGTVG